MYANLANNSSYGINAIGAYFSDTIIIEYPDWDVPFEPQIENKAVITDTLNWTLIEGIYQAKGKEQYLMIGNFRNNEETESQLVNSNSNFSHGYYQVDNISLVKVNCENYIVPKNNISIYPNPTTEGINIKIKNQEFSTTVSLQLFSANGQLVASNQIEGKDIYTWNVDNLSEGIYFLEIIFLDKTYIRKVIKSNI